MNKIFKIITFIFSVIIISSFGFVENVKAAWYNASWSYRKPITIDHTYVDSDLSNFPVLVSFDTSSIEANIQDDGDDLLFTSSDGSTKLSHEIELYDESTNTAKIWVKVPTVNGASNTTIYMYYGNASCSSQQDGTNVWDSNFTAVWHMHNDPNSAGTQQDATANNKDGTSVGSMTTSDLVDAKIGKGWDLDGSNDGMSSTLTGTTAFTWSAWVRLPSNGATYKSIITIGGSSYILMDLTGNTPNITGSFWSSDGMGGSTLSMTSMSTLTWYYVTLTRQGNSTTGGYKAYKDGAYTGQANTGTWTAPTNAIYVGQRADNSAHDFIGIVDEVRISNTNRSADWIKFEYYNMNESDNEISFGTEETAGGGPCFSAGPSDGGSYSGAPTIFGNNVAFTATATDGQSDNYYLAICKTNSIIANNNSAPTCAGGNWCISSSTASGSQASCNYVSQAGDGSKAWYAFVCDYNASSSCSSSSQGTGNNGSPFYVIKGYNASIKNTATYSAGSWLSGWLYRKKIVISKSKVDADLTDFPLLVKLINDVAVGGKARSDGYDLRFTSSDGTTLLAYEREMFSVSSTRATANLWVKVPTITTASDTVIYMYYGKADATDDWTDDSSSLANCTGITNSQCVWKEGASQNYKTVLHLNDSSSPVQDSTIGNFDGTQSGGVTFGVTGRVGDATSYDGLDDYLYTYSNPTTVRDNFSLSVWVKPSVLPQLGHIIENGSNNGWGFGISDGSESDSSGSVLTALYGGVTWINSGYTFPLANAWYNLVLVRDSGTTKFYVNGSQTANISSYTPATPGTSLVIGRRQGQGGYSARYFTGSIDEVKISDTARSASWIKFEYFNQASTNNQLKIYPQEQTTSAKTKSSNFKNSASWLSGWTYRKKITISKTKVDTDLTDFPLLVKLTNDTAVGTKGLSTGYDLRFTSSDGTTLLSYERESFTVSSSKATANIWVKVPTITTASDTIIYMYYGKSDATDDWTDDSSSLANCTGITNAQCTWKEGASQNFAGVWHLKEATGANNADSTSNANSGTPTNGPVQSTGKINGALEFDGVDDYVVLSSKPIPSGNFTILHWVNLNTLSASNKVFYTQGTAADGGYIYTYLDVASGKMRATVNGSSNFSVADSAAVVNTWYFVGLTYNNSTNISTLWINGTAQSTTDNHVANYTGNVYHIGRSPLAATSAYMNGLLDDVRISSVARAAEWIKFEYFNQASTNNQLIISAPEQNTSAKMIKR